MRKQRWTACLVAISLAGLLSVKATLIAESGESTPQPGKVEEDVQRVSIEVARDRARLAHNIYSSTLDMIHHRYFREERTTVPARALEEVFARLGRQDNLQGRWIAVNAPAMNIDHRPRDEFEKQAAKAIASGQPDYERIEDGVFRRAAGISLMDKGCLKCHLQTRSAGKVERFAGLVISIRVAQD